MSSHPADRQRGKAIDPGFRGWGRACTDFETGVYTFDTVTPGRVEGRNGRVMAPHVNAWIVVLAIARRLSASTRPRGPPAVPATGSCSGGNVQVT